MKGHHRKSDHYTIVPAYLVEEIRVRLKQYPNYEGSIDNFVLDAVNRSLARIAKWERDTGLVAKPRKPRTPKASSPRPWERTDDDRVIPAEGLGRDPARVGSGRVA